MLGFLLGLVTGAVAVMIVRKSEGRRAGGTAPGHRPGPPANCPACRAADELFGGKR